MGYEIITTLIIVVVVAVVGLIIASKVLDWDPLGDIIDKGKDIIDDTKDAIGETLENLGKGIFGVPYEPIFERTPEGGLVLKSEDPAVTAAKQIHPELGGEDLTEEQAHEILENLPTEPLPLDATLYTGQYILVYCSKNPDDPRCKGLV